MHQDQKWFQGVGRMLPITRKSRQMVILRTKRKHDDYDEFNVWYAVIVLGVWVARALVVTIVSLAWTLESVKQAMAHGHEDE